MPEDDAIEISGLSLAISPATIRALVQPGGEPGRVEVRLAGLRVRLPQAALNAVLAALAPAGEGEAGAPSLQLDLSPGAIAANLSLGARTIAVSVPVQRLALAVAESELRVEAE